MRTSTITSLIIAASIAFPDERILRLVAPCPEILCKLCSLIRGQVETNVRSKWGTVIKLVLENAEAQNSFSLFMRHDIDLEVKNLVVLRPVLLVDRRPFLAQRLGFQSRHRPEKHRYVCVDLY